jgi:FdhD protein
MGNQSVTSREILKVDLNGSTETSDLLVVEEPLEIRVGYGLAEQREEFSLSVTMRTPGADEELVRGFLVSEGIVRKREDIISVKHCANAKFPENTIRAELNYEIAFDSSDFRRNFFVSSSCGVCGKAVIEAVMKELPQQSDVPPARVDKELLKNLLIRLKEKQNVFKHTGGLHASALFNHDGELLVLREDVGRHNALDKLVGVCQVKEIDMSDKILWLSGRIGLELVQKGVMSGVKTIVALGAPSSLAVDLANENMILLIGFLKNDSFNVYTEKESVVLSE